MIELKNVSISYTLRKDKVSSLKETLIMLLKRKNYVEKYEVLKDISFTVKEGEIVGIIGKNGAGKSTLLKIISGVLKPKRGTITRFGTIIPLLELGAGFDYDMTARENIFLNAAMLGFSEKYVKEKYQEIVEFSEIEKFIDIPLRNFSSGMVMRLGFSIATIMKPEILILDEVLAVGDESFQRKSNLRMKELMNGGTTVLLVSHDIATIKDICDRVIWIEDGYVKMIGSPKLVCDQYVSEYH